MNVFYRTFDSKPDFHCEVIAFIEIKKRRFEITVTDCSRKRFMTV